MLTQAIITYFHFIAIILLFISLTVEKILFKPAIDTATAKKIIVFDGIYGGAAVLLLLTGFLKYFFFGKGAAYYNHNHLMWIKLSLFLIVGLLSIKPTVYFLKWRKVLKSGGEIIITAQDYKSISMFIHMELGIAVFIPLLATLLARGFGV